MGSVTHKSGGPARELLISVLPVTERKLDVNGDCFRSPSVRATMRRLMPWLSSPIPSADLDRITVPVTLIWGRHDVGVPLEVAESASARYRWPLHVIEDARDDPALEQPDAFLAAFRAALTR